MRSTVESIKERLSITDVVGTYVKLEKAGSNLRALCPFHQEKTPSFFVSPSRGTYYCFGCGAKGDIFSFIEQTEGLDFSGALKTLAERAHVPLRFERPAERDLKEKLRDALEAATQFFETNLAAHPKPHSYLKDRGLTDAIIAAFRIGYAVPEWRALSEHLKQRGFDEDILEKAGLGKKADKSMYDRFRGRIMFPIADPSGRVIAFSGRIFDKMGEPEAALSGKYVNSPETPLFSKSRVLYAFDRAKEAIRRLNFVILVEGQMDCLMSHQMGYKNTVAVSGTALTDSHLEQLGRLTKRMVLSFDADEAGLAAAGKGALLALARGFDVKAVRMGESKDPAELIASDPERWKSAVKGAVHIVDFFLEIIDGKGFDERKFKMEVGRVVLPYVAAIRSPIDRAHFIAKVAARLELPESAVAEEVARVVKSFSPEDTQPAFAASLEKLSRRETLLRKAAGLLLLPKELDAAGVPAPELRKDLSQLVGESVLRQFVTDEESKQELLFEAEETLRQSPDIPATVAEVMHELKREILKNSFEQTMRALKESERHGDERESERLLKQCKELSRELSALNDSLEKSR